MIGKYLKKFRLDHNMTQQDLAHTIVINVTYYNRFEKGLKRPGYKVIKKMASSLGVTEEFLRGLVNDESDE